MLTLPLYEGYISQPSTGLRFPLPCRAIEIKSSWEGEENPFFAALALGKALLIVADTNTWKVWGSRLYTALSGQYQLTVEILENPRADMRCVEHIMQAAKTVQAIVAVGSGTINDLCKLASYNLGKPYVICATALSMNGYLSANASIAVDGNKMTLPAHMPIAALFDMRVAASAPLRLTQSGLGDSLCRSTAQADWLLSHLLLDTPYNSLPFELLQPYENDLLMHAENLVKGDEQSLELLAATLIVSGIGMTIAGGSHPASQGEHLIAHTMEMLSGTHSHDTYHGEQIGVTTLTMARLQSALLKHWPALIHRPFPEERLNGYFGKEFTMKCADAYAQKGLTAERIQDINQKIQKNSQEIFSAIACIHQPAEKLEAALQAARAPIHSEALGWNAGQYKVALNYAHFTRNRFTFLDVAYLADDGDGAFSA